MKISATQATKILGISHSQLPKYDNILKPEITIRGTKMKTREYDEAFIRSVTLPRRQYRERGANAKIRRPYVLRKGQDPLLASYSAVERAVWAIHISGCGLMARENNITIDVYLRVARLPCDYCGEQPKPRRWGSCKEMYTGHGLDRVDNNETYTETNIVSCCWRCNRMKFKHTREDFIAKCEQITKHQANAKRSPGSDDM